MVTATKDAAIFCAGAALGAGAILFFSAQHKRRKLNQSNAHTHETNGGGYAAEVDMQPLGIKPPPPSDGAAMRNFEKDDILAEQLTRNVQFFGLEPQKKIANSFVVVVGLGGVGSHCAHLLLRSGVGHLRLVDFDQVTLSSLNRHCLATRADVGLQKAICLQRHFTEIVPEAHVEALCEMYTPETEDMVLSGSPDYVIDAIDNIDTKVALLAACRRRGIPMLCVAGAGAKADPTRLKIADIGQSSIDPLARAVRYRLRKEYGITGGIQVLLSTEKPRCGLVYCGDDEVDMENYQVIPNFRIRTIPVLGTTPAIFGLAAAGHVLCELAGSPLDPAPMYRIQAKAVQTQYDRLEEREREVYGVDADALGVDAQEVEVLLREVWQGGSARAPALPPDDRALTRGLGRLALTRWNPTRGATPDNLVLLTREEADAHDAEVALPGGFDALKRREPELTAKVEGKLKRARKDFINSYY